MFSVVRLASRRFQNSVCTVENDDEIQNAQLVMTTTTATLPACNSEGQQLASKEEFETFTEDEYSAKRKSDSEEKSEGHSPPSKLQKLSVVSHNGEVSMNWTAGTEGGWKAPSLFTITHCINLENQTGIYHLFICAFSRTLISLSWALQVWFKQFHPKKWFEEYESIN